jgi:Na+/melibiose symporter-like transporter
METFMAIAVLGSAKNKIIFVLPVGVGTFVGMIVVKALLKKFNSKQLYIASGCYSLVINCVSFAIGYTQFTMEHNGKDPGILQYVFVVCLFLTGLQFGASNLLPTMFQADALDDLELKTGRRLDASLPFAIGLGTVVSGTIASTLAPLILYGENSIIRYVQGTAANPYPVQSYDTKIKLLLFYTIFHGIMMLLAGVPFIFYKLTGATKEEFHNKALAQREANAGKE